MSRSRAWCALLLLLGCPALAADFDPPAGPPPAFHAGPLAASYSGQFVITGSDAKSVLLKLPAVTTNASLVHLDPAVLSVSAERVKLSLYHLLGITPPRHAPTDICLVLHPARWTDEMVTVVSRPLDQNWSYVVQLPDVVAADRYLRGLTGVLLLERANQRSTGDGHCAEIPNWLIDGLTLQMQHDELSDVLLSSPEQPSSRPSPGRPAPPDHNLDALARARQILRRNQALSFAELCWPSRAQLAGEDGGVYQASAQLFVAELLKLNDGPADFRRMLAALPGCYNWQTAFEQAFQGYFPRSLDLEKWWALAVVEFLSHDPGPTWTPGFSAGLLNELLTVPVEVRASSNSLPSHATMPLQGVVRKFSADRQDVIFEAHLHDLRMAELRMAPQFVELTDEYCQALAAYLGERLRAAPRPANHRCAPAQPVRLNARGLVSRLDALDARRRVIEASVQPSMAGNF